MATTPRVPRRRDRRSGPSSGHLWERDLAGGRVWRVRRRAAVRRSAARDHAGALPSSPPARHSRSRLAWTSSQATGTRIRELQPEIERVVEENVATPCIGNERLLLVCALANAFRGDEEEVERLESRAERHHMEGYGMVHRCAASPARAPARRPGPGAGPARRRLGPANDVVLRQLARDAARRARGHRRSRPPSSPRRRGGCSEACISSPSPCARSGSYARTGTSWNGPPSASRRSASTGTRLEPESCSRSSRSRSPG